MLPAAQGSQADSNSTNFDTYGSQDLESALNSIFNNPNTGPFVCRQLIQRLVTAIRAGSTYIAWCKYSTTTGWASVAI